MGNDTHHDVRGLLPFYALGTLTEEEQHRVERALMTTPALQAELAELIAAVDTLSLDAPPIDPGGDVKQAVMAQIRAGNPAPNSPPVSSRPPTSQRAALPQPSFWAQLRRLLLGDGHPGLLQPAFALAALLAVVVLGGALFQMQTNLARQTAALAALETRLSEQAAADNASTPVTGLETQVAALLNANGQLQGQLTTQQATIDALRADLAPLLTENAQLANAVDDQHEVLLRMTSPNSATMALAGIGAHASAHGNIVADPSSGSAILVVAGLPTLPEGQVYQFWFMREGQPARAGTFEVDENGYAVVVLGVSEAIANYDTMGVSIEAEGSAPPAPTSDMVMIATISS